jgi:hypothetical protein
MIGTTEGHGRKLAVGPTKTSSKGKRTVVNLTRDATEALRSHLERQLVEMDKAGDYNWQENGLVLCAPTKVRSSTPQIYLMVNSSHYKVSGELNTPGAGNLYAANCI